MTTEGLVLYVGSPVLLASVAVLGAYVRGRAARARRTENRSRTPKGEK